MRAFFVRIFLQSQNIARKSCQKRLWYEKSAQKTLMKWTPVLNFINILQAAFAPIFFCQKITKPNCNITKDSKSTFLQKSCL